jgi:hypothetical protein
MHNLLQIGTYTRDELEEILSLRGWNITFDSNNQLTSLRRVFGEELLSNNKTFRDASRERKNEINDLNNNLTRYYEIDKTIESITKTMDKLAGLRERAFGKDKIALLEQEAQGLEHAAKA